MHAIQMNNTCRLLLPSSYCDKNKQSHPLCVDERGARQFNYTRAEYDTLPQPEKATINREFVVAFDVPCNLRQLFPCKSQRHYHQFLDGTCGMTSRTFQNVSRGWNPELARDIIGIVMNHDTVGCFACEHSDCMTCCFQGATIAVLGGGTRICSARVVCLFVLEQFGVCLPIMFIHNLFRWFITTFWRTRAL